MTMLTLGAAARLAGVSKSTLTRAIKAGRMSAASRRENGSYELDPAEVTRCFPPRPPTNGGATASMTQYATPDATAALAEAQHRAELAEQRLSDMKAMLAVASLSKRCVAVVEATRGLAPVEQEPEHAASDAAV